MGSRSDGPLPMATAWPVIIHHSMLKTEYETIFRQKQLKVRVSNGVIPGSVVFPLSSVAFLVVPLSRATTQDSEEIIQLSQELIERLDNFLKVHKNCYMLCQAPLHGQNEKLIFSMIQRKYLHTRLNMIPVHNGMEGVKIMLTIAKGLCKPVSDVLHERLEQVVTEQKKSDFMTAALTQLGLTNLCQLIEDSLGSLRNLAAATREELLNCSLDSKTVDKLLQIFKKDNSDYNT